MHETGFHLKSFRSFRGMSPLFQSYTLEQLEKEHDTMTPQNRGPEDAGFSLTTWTIPNHFLSKINGPWPGNENQLSDQNHFSRKLA